MYSILKLKKFAIIKFSNLWVDLKNAFKKKSQKRNKLNPSFFMF